MSNHGPFPDDEIDDLVRAHLRRQADAVDAGAMLRRVRAAVPAEPARPRLWSGRRMLAGLVAVAAVVLVFLGHGLMPGRARASAELLVREAQVANAVPADRCYLVQIVPAPGSPLLHLSRMVRPREMRLWTRGDRFTIESTDAAHQWVLGREESGSVWLVLGQRHALRFGPDELPAEVALSCELYAMNIRTLLEDVLRHCSLSRERTEIPGGPPIHRIRAVSQLPSHAQRLCGAELEIDGETRVLRRLMLVRANRQGQPLATVTFTLIDTASRPDAHYTLDAHLPPGIVVHVPGQRDRRRSFLLRKFFPLPPSDRGKRTP